MENSSSANADSSNSAKGINVNAKPFIPPGGGQKKLAQPEQTSKGGTTVNPQYSSNMGGGLGYNTAPMMSSPVMMMMNFPPVNNNMVSWGPNSMSPNAMMTMGGATRANGFYPIANPNYQQQYQPALFPPSTLPSQYQAVSQQQNSSNRKHSQPTSASQQNEKESYPQHYGGSNEKILSEKDTNHHLPASKEASSSGMVSPNDSGGPGSSSLGESDGQMAKRVLSHDDVAASYDHITKLNQQIGEKTKERGPFRNFNNFVKKKLIQIAIRLAGGNAPACAWQKTSGSEPLSAPKKWVRKSQQQCDGGGEKNSEDSCFYKNYKGLLVLDIACGRGGDIGKWVFAHKLVSNTSSCGGTTTTSGRFSSLIQSSNFSKPFHAKSSQIGCYVGADVSTECIYEAQNRAASILNPSPCSSQSSPNDASIMARGKRVLPSPTSGTSSSSEIHLLVADCWSQDFWENQLSQQTKQKVLSPSIFEQIQMQNGFDIVSVQFALHYACSSLELLRRVLSNVSQSLRKDGVFIGTIVDSDSLSQLVMKNMMMSLSSKEKGNSNPTDRDMLEMGNNLFRIKLSEDPTSFFHKDVQQHSSASKGGQKNEVLQLPFGFMYEFYLEGHVECAEFALPWEVFVDEAAKVGLVLLSSKSEDVESDDVVRSGNFNFASCLQDYEEDPKVRVALGEKRLSAEEKELISLYRTFCFAKKSLTS